MQVHSNRSRGYATIAVVAGLSLVLLAMLTYSLMGNLKSYESQAQAQLKQDYSQKEDAILSALLNIVPNKAIGAMQQGSASASDDYTWETIFDEALTAANAEQAITPEILNSLDLSDAITANSGDSDVVDIASLVGSPVRSYDEGSSYLVNAGNWYEYHMLFNQRIGPHIPAPVMLSYEDYQLDAQFPIVSFEKLHVYNYRYYSSVYYKDLQASTDSYPLYNLMPYPDVKFGYREPGEAFVAKRNWWVFSLTFGAEAEQVTGVPAVTKDYVISIYEVPSQLPLSSSALMKVGKYADGSDWQNVSLDGGIYADAVETEGNVSLAQGAISARKSLSLSSGTQVAGSAVDGDFDDLGKREARALESDSDFYSASLAGNVGKVAFIPLNPGADFLVLGSDGDRSERISPTGWSEYTRGANQAAMRLEILEMTDISTQIPVRVRFSYRLSDGTDASVEYERGTNWPTENQNGGDSIPFQTDVLENGRNALVVHLDRIPAYLQSITGAAGTDVNHSLFVTPVTTDPSVQAPSTPSLASDVCVSIRGGQDMTTYTKGFSLVTDVRLYIAESLNFTPATPPALSGLDSTAEYYPPLSLFAPEKRFGESLTIENPVSLRGQLSSLKTSTSDTFNPMELRGADDERIDSAMMNADLVSLRSPAELPPIHLMNWMVTIEEVH